MIEAITRFSGEYFYLSNFYASPVIVLGYKWPTNEHAYQVHKSTDPTYLTNMLAAPDNPGFAKKLGRNCNLRPDWEQVKVDVMLTCVMAKFSQNRPLCDALLATGDAQLIEGNHWNDTYWGVCDGVGQNMLGQILMKVRSKLAWAAIAHA